MRKRQIVLATLGSLGDLHPVMGLASGLKARGHGVVLATSGFYRDKVEAAGLSFSALRPLAAPDDPHMVRQVLDSRKGPEYLIRTLLMPHIGDMYADLLTATADADFLISGEVVLTAAMVAEKRRLPWAAAILAPFSFFSVYDPPVVPFLPWARLLAKAPPFLQRRLLAAARFATRDWGQPIVELRRSLGLRASRHPLLLDRFSPFLNLALFSEVLGRPQRDWPANTVQTGFVFYDQDGQSDDRDGEDSRLQAFFDARPAPITFTLGSTAVLDAGRFFEDSAEAASRLGRRALLLLGNNAAPENVSDKLLAAGYAPYSAVFPRSACVVHQGGVGTTAQALRAGVPQLVMPYAFDQPDNAARVVRMGVGLCVSRKRYGVDRAGVQLKKLLATAAYGQRARDVGRRISLENGLTLACDAVERAMAMHCHSAAGV